MKQIIIPLIFIFSLVPSGETTIEYNPENNIPYIDVRSAYQYADKQSIVLNSKIDKKIDLSTEDTDYYENLLDKIIECESGGRNVCNETYGCNSGQGILQLIPTTVKTCELALEKNIDPFTEKDSRECAMYLLKETPQGAHHWGYPDGHRNAYHKGIRWGSYSCWSSAL
jgi:hypothetical protein